MMLFLLCVTISPPGVFEHRLLLHALLLCLITSRYEKRADQLFIVLLCYFVCGLLVGSSSRCSSLAAIYGPRQANLVPLAYASREGSREPAHPRSLARTSAARSYKH